LAEVPVVGFVAVEQVKERLGVPDRLGMAGEAPDGFLELGSSI
jgi:hypothetical protein